MPGFRFEHLGLSFTAHRLTQYQWNDSGAGAAWDDMKQSFLDSGVTSLPDFVGDYFHTRPDLSCEVSCAISARSCGDQRTTAVLTCLLC